MSGGEMGRDNETVHVYLDTALIYRACDNPELLERLNRLAGAGITYVFSYAHLTDLAGQATADDVLRITSMLANLKRTVWRIGGDNLACLELAHLMSSSCGVQGATLPRPEQQLSLTWAQIHEEVQREPEAVLKSWRALRATLEQMAIADNLSRDAKRMVGGGERTSFAKAVQKFADGRGSDRDLMFAEARRPEGERPVDRSMLEEAIGQAMPLLDLLERVILPSAESVWGGTDQGAIRAALSELRNAVREGNGVLTADSADASTFGSVFRRLGRSFAVLARVINLMGRPEGAVTSPIEHDVYPWFEVFYRQTLQLLGCSELDESAKQALFRAWIGARAGACRGGYLLARFRQERAERIDIPRSRSDYADIDHLGLLPYVDTMFVDMRTHELMLGIKSDFGPLFARLHKIEEFPSWLADAECPLKFTN